MCWMVRKILTSRMFASIRPQFNMSCAIEYIWINGHTVPETIRPMNYFLLSLTCHDGTSAPISIKNLSSVYSNFIHKCGWPLNCRYFSNLQKRRHGAQTCSKYDFNWFRNTIWTMEFRWTNDFVVFIGFCVREQSDEMFFVWPWWR